MNFNTMTNDSSMCEAQACQNNQASFINKLMDATLTEFEKIPHSTHFFDLAFTIKDFQ